VKTSETPVTGLVYDPDDPHFLADPTDYYRWLRDEAPVHLHAASGAYLLSRFEDVWSATGDWQTFSSKNPFAESEHMASMDPPGHDRLRARLSRHFGARPIAEFAPVVRRLCCELLDALSEGEPVDLVASFAALYPGRVIQRLLGVPREIGDAMHERALEIATAPDSETMLRSMAALEELSGEVVRGNARPDEPGLLQELGQDDPSRRLPEAARIGVCTNLLLAGTDTVTNLIANGLVLLEQHPDVRDALALDARGLDRCIEEMLRIESPVQSLGRRTTRAVALHGREIPAGAEVRLLWGAANRDEREFRHPDRFDPRRAFRRHLAFGHGIHFCLGASLARLEARIAFAEILERWPRHEVIEDELVRLPSLWSRGFARVVARLEPGKASL
jgi:cytochrome P450